MSEIIRKYFSEIYLSITLILFISGLFCMNSVVFPFFAAMASAYIAYPLFVLFSKTCKKREIAAALTVLIILIGIVGIFLVILPVLIKELEGFLDYLPTLMKKIDFYMSKYLGKKFLAGKMDFKNIKSFISLIYPNLYDNGNLPVNVTVIIQRIFSGVFSIASLAINLVIIPLLSYYFLVDWKKIKELYVKLAPKQYRNETENLLNKVNESLAGYLRGQILMAAFVAVFFSITLTAIGIRYGFLIAFAAGIMNMIPYVGFFTGLVPSLLLAIFDNGDLFHIVGVLVIFTSEAAIENIIYPMIMSRTTGINPLLIMFSIFAGASYGGFLGIVVAVPVAAMILPIFESFMEKRERFE